MYKWQATIIGPKDTPYYEGEFFINIEYPRDYPRRSPKFVMITRIFHPNINREGRICCYVFNRDGDNYWKDNYDIRYAISSIIESMKNPIIECHCSPEIRNLYLTDRIKFESKAKEYTKKYAC